MEVARSSFYAEPAPRPADPMILAAVTAICEEYPAYGYRRVGAEHRHRGLVVNGKKARRIMAENGMNPKRRRRYVVTADSDHHGSIFPNIAKEFEAHGPDQLWGEPLFAIVSRTMYGRLPRGKEHVFGLWHRVGRGHVCGVC